MKRKMSAPGSRPRLRSTACAQEFWGPSLGIMKLGEGAGDLARLAIALVRTCFEALHRGIAALTTEERLLRSVLEIYVLGEDLLISMQMMKARAAGKEWTAHYRDLALARYRQMLRVARRQKTTLANHPGMPAKARRRAA